ncbi:hypothetical protein DUI87_02122 [Hirundo rustica rustica]|uniref:Uncharacterized protein n=1 Tax=Hirundo rustica rustica TaxID=333673 RepID=A0A3M0L845_HIRRU|nr:hypothetical protein DUI87_02122 [Hirundo rustica rustica]
MPERRCRCGARVRLGNRLGCKLCLKRTTDRKALPDSGPPGQLATLDQRTVQDTTKEHWVRVPYNSYFRPSENGSVYE